MCEFVFVQNMSTDFREMQNYSIPSNAFVLKYIQNGTFSTYFHLGGEQGGSQWMVECLPPRLDVACLFNNQVKLKCVYVKLRTNIVDELRSNGLYQREYQPFYY